jgi:hypothetical protein
MRRTN